MKTTVDPSRGLLWAFLGLFLLAVLSVVGTGALLSAVCLLLLWFLGSRAALPRFPLLLFLLALVLRLTGIFLLPTQPISDTYYLVEAARSLNQGDLSFLQGDYFRLWAYQMGFVSYEALLLRLWDSNTILQIVNCVVGAGTAALLYYLALEFTEKRAARIVSLCYCCAPMPVLYMIILSNQVLPTFLLLAGLYLLISRMLEIKTWLRYLGCGVLLALADLLRPESIVTAAAIGLYLLAGLRREGWKRTLLHLGILMGVFFGLHFLFMLLFQQLGGLRNGAPWWKFLEGFHYETGGTYAEEDYHFLLEPETAQQELWRRIRIPLPRLLHLFETKMALFWGGDSLFWVFRPLLERGGLPLFGGKDGTHGVYMLLQELNRWLHFTIYALAILGVFDRLRRKAVDLRLLLLTNTVLVSVIVYLLIEVQSRYAFYVQAVLFVLAAPGVECICRIAEKKGKG